LQLNLLALQLAGNIAGRGSTNYKQTQWLHWKAKESEKQGAGQVVILLQVVTFFKQQV